MYLTSCPDKKYNKDAQGKVVNLMCAKMGRPVSENPKSERIMIRATRNDRELLEECCKLTNSSQHDVIMKGIQMVYENEKK